jgi:branched-chain amino acid transport system permease protein
MIQFILAGLVLGTIYAMSALGVIVTYVSAGVLNFAFAASAFFIARFYFYLHVQHQWPIASAAVLSLLVVAPALGVAMWAVLFRLLRLASPLVKIVSTIGLSVALPPIAILLFGNQNVEGATGLAPEPVRIFHADGVAISLDQLIAYACLIATLAIGFGILRYTNAGMRARALVDSEAMASLSGVNPQRLAVAVWALSVFFAGLAGILAAPIIGLDIQAFTILLASAFAAVIAAKLTNLGVAVIVGLLMGVVTSVAQGYLPPANALTGAVIPSIPFIFMIVALVYLLTRSGTLWDNSTIGGALDRAIAPSETASATHGGAVRNRRSPIRVGPMVGIVAIAILPMLLGGFWVGLVGLGLAYGVFFLSYTLVTGEGGMIWLCQITFAGVGAITTAQLATMHHWPVLLALLAGGLVCAVMGMVVGLLTIRLGDLYVALATLTFGVLMENLVFTRQLFYNFGSGVPVSPPAFAKGTRAFDWFVLAIFCVVALFVVNYRRSTGGMAMNAVRWSRPGAQTVGIGIVPSKLFVSAAGAFIAGIGGGLLAFYANAAIPISYETFAGLTLLAVLVTIGIRSVAAAAIAGLVFSFLPAVFVNYLPATWGEIPPALFGVGAVLVARNPDGTLATQARQLEELWARRRSRHRGSGKGPTPEDEVSDVALDGAPGGVGRDVRREAQGAPRIAQS